MQRTVLITGCSSGIGAALAIELHKRGNRVYASARRPDTLAPLAALGLDWCSNLCFGRSSFSELVFFLSDSWRSCWLSFLAATRFESSAAMPRKTSQIVRRKISM